MSKVEKHRKKLGVEFNPVTEIRDLKTEIMSIADLSVDHRVPKQFCELELPEGHAWPSCGEALEKAQQALLHVLQGDPTYIWGLPGTGKDVFYAAVSHYLRIPSKLYQIAPDTDVQPWLYERSFDANGTHYTRGSLFKALTEGCTLPTGETVPYLIVFTDVDRAAPAQLEYLRLILDSTKGRIQDEEGKTHEIFPGTMIGATANSAGGGDHTGRNSSAQTMDASLMERFPQKFCWTFLEWDDEVRILSNIYPELFLQTEDGGDREIPQNLKIVKKVISAMRTALMEGKLYTEFSMRHVSAWVKRYKVIKRLRPNHNNEDLWGRSFAAILDGLDDPHIREEVRQTVQPHLNLGA